MASLRIGLMADPGAPTEIARELTDLGSADDVDLWDITMVSEPFTTGSDEVRTATERLRNTPAAETGISSWA